MERFKSFAPHLIAVVAFLLFVLVYFLPQFQGKALYQGDIQNYRGMSKEIVDFREETGEEALWTNRMFGGMPAFQISVRYTGNVLKAVDKVLTLGIPKPAGYVFLYFLGFYLLGIILGLDWRLSMAGAFAFGLSSYFFIILEAGHNTKAHAIAYMAPILASVIMTFRGNWLWGGLLTALFAGLQVMSNHLQITYYTLLLLIIVAIVYAVKHIKEQDLSAFGKKVGILVVAAILAGGANLGRLWSTYEYGKFTTRGKSELTLGNTEENQTDGLDKDYATAWSYGVAESFTLMIPNFMGGSSQSALDVNSNLAKRIGRSPQAQQFLDNAPTYWGQQPFTSGPVYAGAIICFLFVLGMFYLPTRTRWWLGIGTLMSLTLAWGRNFQGLTWFFLDYFPLYDKFRAVSMILVVAELTLPVGAVMTLHALVKNKPKFKEIKKSIYYSLGLTAGICLILALAGGSFFDFVGAEDARMESAQWYGDLLEDRKDLLKADAWRSFLFIVLSAGLVWAFLAGKAKSSAMYLGMGLLILVDMVPVNLRYLDHNDFVPESRMDNPFTPTQADRQILQDQDYYRVYNLTERLDASARTSYFHNNVGGYHGAKLQRFQDLIDHQLSQGNRAVINMLNVRYYITEGNQPRRNPQALGNVWKVDEIQWVENANEEMTAIGTEEFAPYRMAVVDRKFQDKVLDYNSNAQIKIELTEYAPNRLAYSYSSDKNALTIFSEIYYPKGWNAYVDGELYPHFRANYVLRGMVVPAGEHELVFKFEPKSYTVGNLVSLVFSALILLALAYFAFRYWRENVKA